jgi:hypothetical protein
VLVGLDDKVAAEEGALWRQHVQAQRATQAVRDVCASFVKLAASRGIPTSRHYRDEDAWWIGTLPYLGGPFVISKSGSLWLETSVADGRDGLKNDVSPAGHVSAEDLETGLAKWIADRGLRL